ncbi:hypothetical protein CDD83_6916 [Cordyceps sp. RAO-2017]|nr:hypothetical protein CDD83_6916 [Cordyceps sp. RAO-2017]
MGHGSRELADEAQRPDPKLESVGDSSEPYARSASHGNDTGSDADAADVQAGVRNVEATTQVWTRNHVIAAYVLIWLIYFVDSTHQVMAGGLDPYVTSAFRQHSLTPTTGILSQLVGGLFKLPLAKILDIWGRPQGFSLATLLLTVGLVMMAACKNVETYAAAQVFYWVGFNGMGYTMSVFIADTSALENRALMFAFLYSPFIITSWIGGPVGSSFLYGAGWRWAFGTFAIATPLVSVPLIALFLSNFRKAKARGLVPRREKTGRTWLESVRHYLVEFDVVGLLLITGGLALFLLSFSLYATQPGGWRSPMILCMLIFGLLLLISFGVYERFMAPVQFLPYKLLVDRTIAGGMVLAIARLASFSIWIRFFTSFLQVVNGLSFTESLYVLRIQTVGSCLWALLVGLLIRQTGRFKWLALYCGVPLAVLGTGLMIHFRQPHVNVGYIVMCQIFIAFAGGTLNVCSQMAVMAPVTHQHVAVVLAILTTCSSIGNSIGAAVASAVWSATFPQRLAELLPPESQANRTAIYGSLSVQLSYPIGSPTREAISEAYGDAQRMLLIAATCAMSVGLVSVLFWRDIRVKDVKHVQGQVI